MLTSPKKFSSIENFPRGMETPLNVWNWFLAREKLERAFGAPTLSNFKTISGGVVFIPPHLE